MIRSLALALPVLALSWPAGAQQADEPLAKADTSLVEACLDNISIAQADGVSSQPRDCIGVAAGACMEHPDGQTTAGMIECLGQEYDYWDGLLNASYAALMARAETADAGDTTSSPKAPKRADMLRQMQRDWLAFRNSTCDWQVREYEGGSIVGPLSTDCHMTMTGEQALRLRAAEHQEQ